MIMRCQNCGAGSINYQSNSCWNCKQILKNKAPRQNLKMAAPSQNLIFNQHQHYRNPSSTKTVCDNCGRSVGDGFRIYPVKISDVKWNCLVHAKNSKSVRIIKRGEKKIKKMDSKMLSEPIKRYYNVDLCDVCVSYAKDM